VPECWLATGEEASVVIRKMNDYDLEAWAELERWRTARLTAKERHLLPKGARKLATGVREVATEQFEKVPGSERFAELFTKALEGALALVSKAADVSLRRQAILDAYGRAGFPVTELAEIRKLELAEIDRVMPRLGLRYTVFTTAEGAVAGLAASGGGILAGGGAIFGAGAGAAPGAGTIVGALAMDAATVLGAMTRAVSHIAAYYGYDTELPAEQVFAMGILSFSLTGQAGKSAAYVELNKVIHDLVRRANWATLNQHGVTKVVRMVYERLGLTLTKRKLGQAIPAVGVVVGAGLNARMLDRLTTDADRLYRERFLRDKYGIPAPVLPAGPRSPDPGDTVDQVIPLAELVEEELGITPAED
jgi:hypothetical protein